MISNQSKPVVGPLLQGYLKLLPDYIEHLGIESGSFTFISESHGSTSWIDHCVCTGQAHASISSINVIYDNQSSDHFPLSICIDISIVPMLDMYIPDSRPMLNWGKASDSERSAYTDKCSELGTWNV